MSDQPEERYEEFATLPHPPLGRARHGTGGAGILPGDQVHHRSAGRERFLL